MQPQEQHAHRVREFYQQHQQHQHHQQEQQQHPSSGGGGNGGCRQLPGGACDHAPHAHATEQPHAERQQQHAERGRGRGRGRGRAVPPEVAALTALYADAFSTVPYDAGDGAGEPCSSRPILLFDLNGTLTSHTSQRQAAGMTRIRPGAEALARLASKFRLGIYTSSTVRTVATAVAMLEAAAGCVLFQPRLILHRDHTQHAPQHHLQGGGNAWDTVKPLGRWFSRLGRVLLFDDDAFKAVPGEERSMVVVPCWAAEEDAGCRVLAALADAVEEQLGSCGADEDVRAHVPAITRRLHEAHAARVEELMAAAALAAADPNAIDLDLDCSGSEAEEQQEQKRRMKSGGEVEAAADPNAIDLDCS